eukprot:4139142-Prymnesium_polylepis.1
MLLGPQWTRVLCGVERFQNLFVPTSVPVRHPQHVLCDTQKKVGAAGWRFSIAAKTAGGFLSQ